MAIFEVEMRLATCGASQDEFDRARRPTMIIEVDRAPLNEDCLVCIEMSEGMGQPKRFTELTPVEARTLARHLIACAEEAEREPAPEEANAHA
jgi:hypothetical protein